MPRIIDVVRKMGIENNQFAELYKEVMGFGLKPKTSIISEKNMEKIQKLVEKKGLAKKKTVVKKVVKKIEKNSVKKLDKAGSKVIKSDDFQDKTGFMSCMGFGGDIHEEDVKEEVVEDTSVSKKDFDVIREQALESRKKREASNPSRPNRSHRLGGSITHRKQGTKPSFFKGKTYIKKDVKATPLPVKKPKQATTSKTLIKKEEIIIDKNTTVKEFSEKMGIGLPEVMKVLLKNQIMVSINSSLDFDTASLIAEELGVKVKKKEAKLNVESFLSGDLQAILELDKDAEVLEERSPIVTVMGHVDHGKTTLLDYLRKTSVADVEAGGITQSIGASVVQHAGKKITFIDTPGHELFTSLRARGAKLTNVAIIVVAADDSVMPQTIESINHAKAAGVPIIIAVTKVDKPGIHIDQIKNDLSVHGITPEDWGGDTPIVGVSGITGQGIPDLLEAILLQSEMLELKFNPKRSAIGVVLDAYKDPKQGIVTSIIVMTGTMHLRDIVVAHNTFGKIRRMWDRQAKNVKDVKGGQPVQVLGFTELPEPGCIVEIVKSEKDAINKINILKAESEASDEGSVVQEFLSQLKGGESSEVPTLRLVLKSDGSSSLEALKQAVNGVMIPENVALKVIHTDVGHFSDSDLSLAQASKALLLGFSVGLSNSIKKSAQGMGVDAKNFNIIYELTEYLEKLLLGLVEIEEEEVMCGKLEVLGIFYKKGKQMVIGGMVIDGKVVDKAKFNVYRKLENIKPDDINDEDVVFTTGVIQSLQQEQQAVKEVKVTYECGMKIKVNKKIMEGDILEFLIMQEKKTDKKGESNLEQKLAEQLAEKENGIEEEEVQITEEELKQVKKAEKKARTGKQGRGKTKK